MIVLRDKLYYWIIIFIFVWNVICMEPAVEVSIDFRCWLCEKIPPFNDDPSCFAKHGRTYQYLVCPPCAAVAALIRLCMEFTRVLIMAMGMLFHSSCKACVSWTWLVGAFGRLLTLLSSSSHKCSIGDKSGLNAGQSSGCMLLLARNCWQTLATWGRALSCCNIRFRACTHGTATGRRISSLYLTPFKLPSITINGDLNPYEMPPQTHTEPPPNLSRSTTHASV